MITRRQFGLVAAAVATALVAPKMRSEFSEDGWTIHSSDFESDYIVWRGDGTKDLMLSADVIRDAHAQGLAVHIDGWRNVYING
jgi:hypothetical protein